MYNELWGYTSGKIVKLETEAEALNWTAKDEKALALIVLCVSRAELGHIRKAKTSKEAWDELARIHCSKGPVRKAVLYRQLYNLRKSPSEPMAQYINNFQEKVNSLEYAGIEIPSELQSIMLLSSLPENYENFCVAIESRDQIPTVDFIKGKLMEEEARRQTSNDREDDATSALVSRKAYTNKDADINKGSTWSDQDRRRFNGDCFNCGKYGHLARQCRLRKKMEVRLTKPKKQK